MFLDDVSRRAQENPGRIILPEAEDERTLRAATAIEERGIGKVCLVGNEDTIAGVARQAGVRISAEIIDPSQSSHLDGFAGKYYELRKAKGVSEADARTAVLEPITFGMMMLDAGLGDGLVAGACHSTAATLRPALQILRTAPGVSMVSSFFFMSFPDTTYLFADSGLVENPDAEQLAEIALCTAESAMGFGIDPLVAMLSYSTKGSAHSPLTEKVVEATRIAQERAIARFGADSPVRIDGELQGDAALVHTVGQRKAPGSDVAGKARVLIFPDLNSGNIAYKLVERLGGASAYGPIVQGLRLPVNDLSRGCSWEDIVGVAAVTTVQWQIRRSAMEGSQSKSPALQ
ncbi:MAG: phosphate acetyltransferase [Candidatus Hydrogenedentes bacterium]|nr:phosphate acetyltransferase [Candidatus Hydrogenedentota bacterium]